MSQSTPIDTSMTIHPFESTNSKLNELQAKAFKILRPVWFQQTKETPPQAQKKAPEPIKLSKPQPRLAEVSTMGSGTPSEKTPKLRSNEICYGYVTMKKPHNIFKDLTQALTYMDTVINPLFGLSDSLKFTWKSL